MGNKINSRLHKKEERPGRSDNEPAGASHTANSGRTEVDRDIMSGPNRARAADPIATDSHKAAPVPRGAPPPSVDPAAPATTARGRT